MTPFQRIGSFTSATGAEISAYDSDRQLLYVVAGNTTLQAIDISDPTAPVERLSFDIAQFDQPIAGANSIAFKDGFIAVALGAEVQTDPGAVALVDLAAAEAALASGGDVLAAVKVFVVGALPDMVTFTPDGSKILVANEGEPDEGVDPDGSVGIIDISGDFDSLSQSDVTIASFEQFNGQEADLRAGGVRIFPDATAAQDFEPEYIAVSPDGTKAFVTLQENNAIAIVDINSATVESIKGLGLKDYSLPGNGLDASDRDDGINISPQPVFGLYMPDSIASFESNGETFYLIANEGDDRGDADEDDRGDAIRLKDLADVTSFGRSGIALDPSIDPALLEDDQLGRLTISSIDGDTDGDGDIDQIVAYGGRSFSVLDSNGNIIFDSGDQIAQITAAQTPELFNANDGDPEEVDNRSDNKGAEPESVTTGVIDGKTYAFVGLERAGGGVLVYDLTNPAQPEFVQYARSDEDIAPEGLSFISAEESPTGQPLLTVANEESNTIAIYQAGDMVAPAPMVSISEFHYDNAGADTGEFIELTATAGTDLTGWQIVLYNGNGGAPYDTEELAGVVADQGEGKGTFVIDFPSNGIQNGAPDGIALVNPGGEVVEFISYEGSFIAVGGPADGITSTDIGVSEPGSTPVGQSLQLIDGVWTGPAAATKGALNGIDNGGGDGGGDGGNGGDNGGDGTLTPIYDIQGAAHISPLVGSSVTTSGIVTAVDSNGFYLQDAAGDGNIATSDALFVFTSSAPGVTVGDELQVAGTVSEFIPGGASTRNLSTTQISGDPTITTLSTGNALPAAVILGSSNRTPPSENIDDDAFGSFDPTTDGIDFFESVEGMRVTAEDLLVINGTNRFGEIFTVANGGANATGLSDRGTLNISPDDFNPEKIQIDADSGVLPGFDLPIVDVGATLGDVTGVVGYGFGNFEVIPTEAFTVTGESSLTPDSTQLTGSADQLTVASYNVLNLETNDDDGDTDVANGRFEAIAQQIVSNLATPDIVGLQEIQDNSGSDDDGTVSASETLQALVDAITDAGGPTYAFIDNTFITDNSSGGQPGGNIRTAFLYNPDRVSQVGEAEAVGNQNEGSAFNGARLPLAATFEFNGETVTVVNNHFSSKGGSAPILGTEQNFADRQEDPSVNGSLDERREQAQAVNNFVDGVLAGDADANVVVLGDLNEFEFVSPLQILEGTVVSTSGGQSIESSGNAAVLNNLINNVPEDERYSFIFQGNSQQLDHVLVSDSLATTAEVDIVYLNSEFAETPQRASDHDPIVTRLNLGETTVEPFQLQLLHLSDQEAGIPALDDAPNASAVINALRDDFENTLLLSSGDAFIPGLFFSASEEAYGGAGRADILIQNELGIEAIAFGNHEFDRGTALLQDLIAGAEDDLETPEVDESFAGALFPYLSSNLDFSTSEDLADLVVPDDQAPQPNSIAATTVIDVNGEQVGVVGATTPTLPIISSPEDVTVLPGEFDAVPTDAQLDALAAEIQTDVDELLSANPGLNKVVVLSHMQQISVEQALATRLKNVDIIVAGGSNTRLVDENDRLRAGDSAQGDYPIFSTDANGEPIAIVNTDGNYQYIGRLVVDFDTNGNIIPGSYDATVSGAYATDEQGVADLSAQGLVDPEIQQIVDTLEEVIIAKESNVFGVSDVYLNGLRGSVRTQETNLGNLTADANLAIAKQTDPSVVLSLKNGGGIRDDIGQVIVPAGGTGEPERLPNEAIPGIKPAGGISETDIANALSFNNGLTLLTITAAELLEVIEYGIAASTPDDTDTQGRFPQVAGIEFSFDLTAEPGDRVQSLVILDEDGSDAEVVVQNSELVGDPTRTFRMVTLGFLAEGGDGYPFPMRDVVDISSPDDAARTGVATFAPDGSEQDALAEYLAANFGADNPFNEVDTSRAEDTRLQNLAFREDTVIDGGDLGTGGNNGDDINFIVGAPGDTSDLFGDNGSNFIIGGSGDSTLFGAGGNDTLKGDLEEPGGNDKLFGGSGDDLLLGGSGNDILFGESGDDTLFGEDGSDYLRGGEGTDLLFGGAGTDIFALAPGEGPSIILDFAGDDLIGLTGGLTLGQIYRVQSGDNTVIGTNAGEVLSVVIDTDVSQFGDSAFLAV